MYQKKKYADTFSYLEEEKLEDYKKDTLLFEPREKGLHVVRENHIPFGSYFLLHGSLKSSARLQLVFYELF